MYDVAIIGGGLNGLATASLLAAAGLNILLVDQHLLSQRFGGKKDGRGIALTRFSKEILQKYNIWPEFGHQYGTIKRVIVADEMEPFLLKLDHQTVHSELLGHIIEHDQLLEVFYNFLQKRSNVTILDGVSLERFSSEFSYVEMSLMKEGKLLTEKASLLLGADGKNSRIREMLGIEHVVYDYYQTALVFNIEHEIAHNYDAYEHFYARGSFAMLPLYDQHQSSVVWVEKSEVANIYSKMPVDELAYFVQDRARLTHGEVNINSEVYTYPLSLVLAKQPFKNRVALIGDSLHFIHPIAGQGFNLSLRDIEALTRMVVKSKKLGLDFGSETSLEGYVNERKKGNLMMSLFTDLLNRGCSNSSTILRALRKIGLSYIDTSSHLKKKILNVSWIE